MRKKAKIREKINTLNFEEINQPQNWPVNVLIFEAVTELNFQPSGTSSSGLLTRSILSTLENH